jgi:hypothetical protein
MQLQQQMQQKIQAVQANPQMLQQLQHSGQGQQLMAQAQQQLQQKQQQIAEAMQQPTLELMMRFFKDYRTTSFVLDIETDSTIQADENTEKQRRGQFIGMLAALLPQLGQLIAAEPGTAPFCGEILKFAVAPFRAARSLDSAIDDLVQQMEAKGKQGGANRPSPEERKAQMQMQIEQQKLQNDKQQAEQDRQLRLLELQNSKDVELAKIQGEFEVAMFEAQARKEQGAAKVEEIGAKVQLAREGHDQKMREGHQKMVVGTQMAHQKQVDAQQRNADMAARRAQADRSQIFKERQAAMRPIGGAPR